MFPRILISVLLSCFAVGVAVADTLRVATYNSLNLTGTSIVARISAFRTVMTSIDPDLITLQEVQDEEAVDQFLSFVLLPFHDDWACVLNNGSSYNDNAFFYRTSKISFLSQRDIPTTLRDITEYTLRPATADTALRLFVYSLHLKANSGSGNNVERRREEALALRQQLDQSAAGSLFMACGDYNLLSADEPAYELLLAPTPNVNGQLFDPIDSPGHWDGSVTFAAIHTIGTYGLNARFDFILVSNALMDTVGSHVLPGTYWAYGNDGRHFGRAINAMPNFAIPDSVADALFAASDHLPVVMDFVLQADNLNLADRAATPRRVALLTCYPNPFNSSATISYDLPHAGRISLRVFDLLGREVAMLQHGMTDAGTHRATVDGSGLASGIYFARAESMIDNSPLATVKLVLLK
jgi:endonuclease/exonuclease/phosphatase family metal-dependent hydrolase